MRVTPTYISIGANRSSSCAAHSQSGVLAFGAGKLVALWIPDDDNLRGIYAAVPGHKGQVTTIKLLEDTAEAALFVSGDTAGELRIWSCTRDGGFECVEQIAAHQEASVSALGVPPWSTSGRVLNGCFFSGGSDGSVRFWRSTNGKVEKVQALDLKGKLPLDLAVAYLPGSNVPVLVIACTDRRIQIWTHRDGSKFHLALSLEGHEDWVQCLAFTAYPSESSSLTSDLLLASGSQDNYVRLWRVSAIEQKPENGDGGLDILDEFERKLAGEAGCSTQISTKAHVLAVDDGGRSLRYDIALEALLIGHEAGLKNVSWSPSTPSSPPLLLSSSSDNSLIIWGPSASASVSKDGIWVPEHRFGSLGGRGLAFYGGLWGSGGNSVLASGWNGGWERWMKESDGERWEPKSGLTGHFGEARSVSWDPKGDYLLSVGSDQTSRIHAPCAQSPSSVHKTWAEIARPQIHGYDMTDAAWLGPLRFVSGADEKVVRVFDAPRGFLESLRSLGVQKVENWHDDAASRPQGATVPPLGLSNRALGKDVNDLELPSAPVPNGPHQSISHAFISLPTEEELASSTLWPEVEKVYGHGYEIATVATSHDGSLFATACRATNSEHAVVRVVSTKTWELFGEALEGHTLTITKICFSPDDERILTCSRDRGWRMFTRNGTTGGYEPCAKDEKAHLRMVLDCCWSTDGRMFATASRDKTVKLWTEPSGKQSKWDAACFIKLSEAATAVDIFGSADELLLAVGAESGCIEVYAISLGLESVPTNLRPKSDLVITKSLHKFDVSMAHAGPVNRLAWQRRDGILHLASCSDDRSVRIFSVDI